MGLRGPKKGSPKNGGRKKGTPNKKSQDVSERLAALGYDTVAELHKLLSKERNFDKKLKAYVGLSDSEKAEKILRLMEFEVPKRKALDVNASVGGNGTPMTFKIGWADDDDAHPKASQTDATTKETL